MELPVYLKQSSISKNLEQTFKQHQRTFTHLDNKENFENSAFEQSASELLNDLLQPEENRMQTSHSSKKNSRGREYNSIHTIKTHLMLMNTGENEQGLRKIIDMTRMISIVILLLHFYNYCYNAFAEKATYLIGCCKIFLPQVYFQTLQNRAYSS